MRFAKIPQEIIKDLSSGGEWAAWATLSLFRSDKNPEVWAKQKALAEIAGISDREFSRSLNKLVSKGLVTVRRTMNGNRYRLPVFEADQHAKKAELHKDRKAELEDARIAECVTPELRDGLRQKSGMGDARIAECKKDQTIEQTTEQTKEQTKGSPAEAELELNQAPIDKAEPTEDQSPAAPSLFPALQPTPSKPSPLDLRVSAIWDAYAKHWPANRNLVPAAQKEIRKWLKAGSENDLAKAERLFRGHRASELHRKYTNIRYALRLTNEEMFLDLAGSGVGTAEPMMDSVEDARLARIRAKAEQDRFSEFDSPVLHDAFVIKKTASDPSKKADPARHNCWTMPVGGTEYKGKNVWRYGAEHLDWASINIAVLSWHLQNPVDSSPERAAYYEQLIRPFKREIALDGRTKKTPTRRTEAHNAAC